MFVWYAFHSCNIHILLHIINQDYATRKELCSRASLTVPHFLKDDNPKRHSAFCNTDVIGSLKDEVYGKDSVPFVAVFCETRKRIQCQDFVKMYICHQYRLWTAVDPFYLYLTLSPSSVWQGSCVYSSYFLSVAHFLLFWPRGDHIWYFLHNFHNSGPFRFILHMLVSVQSDFSCFSESNADLLDSFASQNLMLTRLIND